MKHLYLHIGSHKTGSTTIQRLFKRNATKLAEQGFFFRREATEARNASLSRWFSDAYLNGNETVRARIAAAAHSAFEELKTTDCDNAIVSAEGFSWVSRVEMIERVRAELGSLAETITVIYVIRRQDQLAISHHQQGVKSGRLGYQYYGGRSDFFDRVQEQAWDYLDHFSRYSNWARVFGEENMRVQIFEPQYFVDGDLLKQICKLMNIPDPDKLTFPKKANESLDAGSQFLMEQLDQRLPALASTGRSALRERINELVTQFSDNNSRNTRLLPSRSEAEAFYRRYAESNEQLRAQVFPDQDRLFSEDFSGYPEHNDRELITPADYVDFVRHLMANVEKLDPVVPVVGDSVNTAVKEGA